MHSPFAVDDKSSFSEMLILMSSFFFFQQLTRSAGRSCCRGEATNAWRSASAQVPPLGLVFFIGSVWFCIFVWGGWEVYENCSVERPNV